MKTLLSLLFIMLCFTHSLLWAAGGDGGDGGGASVASIRNSWKITADHSKDINADDLLNKLVSYEMKFEEVKTILVKDIRLYILLDDEFISFEKIKYFYVKDNAQNTSVDELTTNDLAAFETMDGEIFTMSELRAVSILPQD